MKFFKRTREFKARLIGKTLAIISDARFGGNDMSVVTERLLCITGEDTTTIDRKFLDSVTMKLPTRFMFLTNELPKFQDASGALAGRFLVLRLTKSFFGNEDTGLTEKLMSELSGILKWAVEGLKQLRERGHFVQPDNGADFVEDLENLSSPVALFVRESCDIGAGHRASIDDLYGAWKTWCDFNGRDHVGTKQSFGRDLSAAVPTIKRRRGTSDAFYDGIKLKAAS